MLILPVSEQNTLYKQNTALSRRIYLFKKIIIILQRVCKEGEKYACIEKVYAADFIYIKMPVVFLYPDGWAFAAFGVFALQAAFVGEGGACLHDSDLCCRVFFCGIYDGEESGNEEILLGGGDGGAVFCGAVCDIRGGKQGVSAAFGGLYDDDSAVRGRRDAWGDAELEVKNRMQYN